MEAAPRHLRSVDTRSGEVHDHSSHEDLQTQLDMAARELAGYRIRLARAEAEVRRVQGDAPEAGEVKSCLDYWAKRVVEEGWWSRLPAFKPGHPRWSAVSARLQEPEYDPTYLTTVVEGALMQPRSQLKREWIDAQSIFKQGNLERHYERALDPRAERVRQVMQLPDDLLYADLKVLAAKCDCGHLSIAHSRWMDPHYGYERPCLFHGCECLGFDDIFQRAEAWKAERAA